MKCFVKTLLIFLIGLSSISVYAQNNKPSLYYVVTFPNPATKTYHVEIQASGWPQQQLDFKMPNWMPGYYQKMPYAKGVENIVAKNSEGVQLPITNVNENTWRIQNTSNKPFTISYDIKTTRKFVANSYVDEDHAYLIPENSFLYVDGFLDLPATVKIDKGPKWQKITTGLTLFKEGEYTAENFDILYDCPILIGDLEELPAFDVRGVKHRFIGYKIGEFDKEQFMLTLKKMVESAVNIIGDIPFDEYTFIGIGPGRGGIEHLNNTTVSFDGNGLKTPAALNTVMNFLAHEYFHHYNVKRIRPFELGPFDYDNGSRTNLLWVSEGLSVYYEYLIVKRAGLSDERTLLANFENNLNNIENNPGRHFQSLIQSSYNTWKDGPFGTQGEEAGKTIAYYEKGPLVGLLLDFGIRNATKNEKSLDDVMRHMYWKYYKEMGRGFTDAEFQQACETIAGAPLTELFEYVNTTKELDYNKYLRFAGLRLNKAEGEKGFRFTLQQIENPNALQKTILNSWLGN
ncbi:M61 family metallopeptidase [Roseivirga echinicomitans]